MYGELYKLYDKFNSEMAVKFTPKLNEAFGTNLCCQQGRFSCTGEVAIPGEYALSKIPEMDNYRTTDDIHGILEGFFASDGKDCKLKANIDDLVKIVQDSAEELAKKVDMLYAN